MLYLPHELRRVVTELVDYLQMDAASKHGCAVVANGAARRQVYWDVKEAIAALSPIVRNRLHGIPSYILDYADLIVSNQVEKPFLKPVLLLGPCTDEKWWYLQTLADEFPDVFAFPPVYTDEPAQRPADPYLNRCAAGAVAVSHSVCLSVTCNDNTWYAMVFSSKD